MPAQDDYLSNLADLGRELRRRGHYQPRLGRALAELALHVGLLLAGMALFLWNGSVALRVFGLLVSSLGALGVSTNTHAASHYAAGTGRTINRALTYFGYPFMLGLSASYWWRKHCIDHHGAPNVVGTDADIELMPFFALNRDEYVRASSLGRAYFSFQTLLLPFALALNALNMQRQGLWFLAGRLWRRDTRSAVHFIDLACLCAHVGLFLWLAARLSSPTAALLYYGLRLVLLGYASFMLFAPAHFPHEAPFIGAGYASSNVALRQIATTLNFKVGPVGRFLCAGLDLQIEHHLFPRMHHAQYPAISAEVQAFCERHGYPYRRLAWHRALGKAIEVFRRPKAVIGSLELAPTVSSARACVETKTLGLDAALAPAEPSAGA